MSYMSFALFFFSVVAVAAMVRVVSRRLRQQRQERLRVHLNWVNPEPARSRSGRGARR